MMAQASLRRCGVHGVCMVCAWCVHAWYTHCISVQVSMQEPPSSFAAFKPVPAPPKPPAAGFDANAGGFEL
jgi:hypothetical protein